MRFPTSAAPKNKPRADRTTPVSPPFQHAGAVRGTQRSERQTVSSEKSFISMMLLVRMRCSNCKMSNISLHRPENSLNVRIRCVKHLPRRSRSTERESPLLQGSPTGRVDKRKRRGCRDSQGVLMGPFGVSSACILLFFLAKRWI